MSERVSKDRLDELRGIYFRLLSEHICNGGQCDPNQIDPPQLCQRAREYWDVIGVIEAEIERRAQRCETCGAAIWGYPGATDGHCYWLLDRTFEGRCNIEIERDCGCPCWESLEQWAERGIGEPTLWQPREEPQPCQ